MEPIWNIKSNLQPIQNIKKKKFSTNIPIVEVKTNEYQHERQ